MRVLRRFLEAHVGSSFPTTVETTDGATGILKMRGSGNGEHSLAAEFLVNRIATRCGWPVPDVFPVSIPEHFPWEFGTDEFDDIVRRSFGVNLGIELVPGAVALSAAELRDLPLETLQSMARLDALFCNHDRTVHSSNALRDANGKVWFVDHGSSLVLLRSSVTAPFALASNHVLKADEGRYLTGPLPEGLLAAATDAVAELPAQWLEVLGFTREDVLERIRARLGRFV